jgi:hypothetical protein
VEREFNFSIGGKGRVLHMCTPGDQRNSSNNRREQVDRIDAVGHSDNQTRSGRPIRNSHVAGHNIHLRRPIAGGNAAMISGQTSDPAFNRRLRINDDVVERSAWTKQDVVEEVA